MSDRKPIYDSAERAIYKLLLERSYLAHNLVYKLHSIGIPSDVGSSTMWSMIGEGLLDLSNDWIVTITERGYK